MVSVVVSGCSFAIQIFKSLQNLFLSVRRNALCASDCCTDLHRLHSAYCDRDGDVNGEVVVIHL